MEGVMRGQIGLPDHVLLNISFTRMDVANMKIRKATSIVGRRPKERAPSSFQSNNSSYDPKLRSICGNADHRFSNLLLDWDVMKDFNREKKPSSIETEKNASPSTIPAIFSCFHEYITKWEPLLIMEVKETIVSNFMSKPKNRKTGSLQFVVDEAISTAYFEFNCQASLDDSNM